MTNIIDRLKAEGVLKMYLDFRSGSYLDLSGKDNTGAPTDITLGYNGAEFDGSTSVVEVEDNGSIGGDEGCLVVVSDAMVNEVQHLFDKASQFGLSVPSTGVLEISAIPRSELLTTSETLVTIRFQGTSGKKIYINWGDGTETDHTLNGAVNVDAMHTYSVAGLKRIKISGDLGECTTVSQLGNPLVFGDITDFMDPFSALIEGAYAYASSFTGNINTAFANNTELKTVLLRSNPDLYGDISVLNSNPLISSITAYSTMVTAELTGMANTIQMGTFDMHGDPGGTNEIITCSSQSVPAWRYPKFSFQDCGMSAASVDNLFIGLNAHNLTAQFNPFIDVTGRNSAGTSASDQAVIDLNSRGYNVTTNK